MISLGWSILASMDRKRLGNRLREIRDGRFTQKELAEAAGVAYGTVQDVESGEGNPQLDKIEAIEGALGLPLIQIYGDKVPLGELLDFREKNGHLTGEELDVLFLFRKLDDRGRLALIGVAKSLLGMAIDAPIPRGRG